MEEYGLTPDQLIAKDFRVIQSSRRGYRPYGKREWIAAIKKIHKQGGSVFAGALQDRRPYLYHQGIWIFGGWDKALRAAGFDPKNMRQRDRWSPDKVVKGISQLRARRLPFNAHHVLESHHGLFFGALRHYGSWNKALIAAGITKTSIAGNSRLGLLRELREAVESGGEIPQALRLQIAHYFGSLRKARIALKTEPRLLSGWSKRKIIAILARRHRAKENLSYAAVRRESVALVSAAEAYFGSWGRALNAAGIDPNLYFVHHRWRKQEARTGLRRV